MASPEVSVIVPVYNTEKYLNRCLTYLEAQAFSDFEVIIVNDGSTDHSSEIMTQWTQKDARFLGFHTENNGLSAARNFGISQSKGHYIAFVDSDDWVHTDFLSRMVDGILQNNADIAYCNLQKVNDEGEIIKKLPQSNPAVSSSSNFVNFNYFGELSWFACNKIFKSELLNSSTFVENIFFEDIASIPPLFLKTDAIVYIDEYLYQYFERDGSISRSFNDKGLDMFQALTHVKPLYDKSVHAEDQKQWKRFYILQGFYSYLAYVARVSDASLQKKMYWELSEHLRNENISKKEILNYKRFGKNYLLSLSPLKMIYYMFALIFKV